MTHSWYNSRGSLRTIYENVVLEKLAQAGIVQEDDAKRDGVRV